MVRRPSGKAARYIGGRWAAKEAVIKAFSGTRRLMLRDVEIRKDAKTKQPLAIVCDEGCEREQRSAEEVYADLVSRWGLRKELSKQQKEDVAGAGGVASTKGLRITKTSMMGNKESPARQELPTSEHEITPAPTSSAHTTPPILSENGILDLNAVTRALEQQDSKPALSAPATHSQEHAEEQQQEHRQEEPQQEQATEEQQDSDEPQSEQSRLREEIKRLRQEEQAEDAWNNLQGQVVKISISHDGEYCIATALAAV
ncbi:unnamed protein product [Aureobasidium mustum]|uniref:4'-phosphopantetheinyl transferase domain-containing protein n=1 Tax=Aureobasidium mustum TaxID=2773714 RepID=A0A9N8PCR1_9PEZI|nr:unnamed protein product [Aureobasidium mustum]